MGWAGTQDRSRGRETAEADKNSVVRKDTGVSPESHPLLGEGRHMGKLPPEDHSHPGVPFRVCDTFANTGKIGSIVGGTKRTQNSTKQTRVITGCIGRCRDQKAPVFVSHLP